MDVMKRIDMHCDTLLECYTKKVSLRDGPTQINLNKLKQGGSLAQCFAIFVVSNAAAKRNKIELEPYKFYKEMVDLYNSEISANSDLMAAALTPKDLLTNESKGLISSILTIEDAVPLDGIIERVDEFFDDGVRIMSLTWNYENSVGYPNDPDPELHLKGLKPFGFEAVARMNELGMIVDVSHLSQGGFKDVLGIAKKPFIASHSCARSIASHQRNLTDSQLKELGDAGGIVGINFCAQFLENGAVLSTVSNIVDNVLYIKNKAGIDSLAWGSDFDGIDGSILEFQDYAGFPIIENALSKHFTDDEIDKINHENFLRVFRDNIK